MTSQRGEKIHNTPGIQNEELESHVLEIQLPYT